MSHAADAWSTLAPGEKRRSHWQTGLDGAPTLPVLAARGRLAGPLLLVTGAVHGDEYEGPAAIHALFERLDPETLHGLYVGLPVVNGPAWRARVRRTPADDQDLNRLFPGSPEPDAGLSRNLAQRVFDHFVRACDLLVDLHSGGLRLKHLPMVGCYRGSSGEAEILARGFGAPLHPWTLGVVPGVLSYEAHRAGKVSLGAEWGGGGALDPLGRDAYVRGLRRILAHLAGDRLTAAELDGRAPLAGRYQESEVGGLFVPAVRLGMTVAEGEPLGHLYDEVGTLVGEPKAWRSGLLAALAHLPWVDPGDRIAYIG